MLDSYNLRVSLDETKKELAHALYQHDAACRVIARLVKENKNLQSILKMTQDELSQNKSLLEKAQ